MIKRLFAVFDNKAIYYSSPFAEPSTAQAARSFSDAINSPNSTLGRHPRDFTLMELGTFDTESGLVTAHSQPIHVAHAVQYIGVEKLNEQSPLFEAVDPETGEIG